MKKEYLRDEAHQRLDQTGHRECHDSSSGVGQFTQVVSDDEEMD
jgi:hypothetical protein